MPPTGPSNRQPTSQECRQFWISVLTRTQATVRNPLSGRMIDPSVNNSQVIRNFRHCDLPMRIRMLVNYELDNTRAISPYLINRFPDMQRISNQLQQELQNYINGVGEQTGPARGQVNNQINNQNNCNQFWINYLNRIDQIFYNPLTHHYIDSTGTTFHETVAHTCPIPTRPVGIRDLIGLEMTHSVAISPYIRDRYPEARIPTAEEQAIINTFLEQNSSSSSSS